jgi:hypothetical protein
MDHKKLKEMEYFDSLAQMFDEYSDYVSVGENRLLYNSQLVEKDADDFAEEEVEYYLKLAQSSDETPVVVGSKSTVKYNDKGEGYLISDQDEILAGPFDFIEHNQFGTNVDRRYIKNGLIGYIHNNVVYELFRYIG